MHIVRGPPNAMDNYFTSRYEVEASNSTTIYVLNKSLRRLLDGML